MLAIYGSNTGGQIPDLIEILGNIFFNHEWFLEDARIVPKDNGQTRFIYYTADCSFSDLKWKA